MDTRRLQINLIFADGADLSFARASVICDHERDARISGQGITHSPVLLMFQDTFSSIVDRQPPVRRLVLTFYIGVGYWDKLGDGLSCRHEFLDAANAEGPDLDHPDARVLRANALENLMLSALSFDEFDEFTGRLRALAPEMPVVSGLPPVIHEIRDHGSPWSSALFHLAMSNYNRNNPAQDRGHYGVAKSTYHLLLATRKQQRLPREDWRVAVFEYCALAMRMANDCQNIRGGDADAHCPEEFLPMLADAIPYMDEYLAVFTGDEGMQRVRDNMQSLLDDTRGRWAAISPDESDWKGSFPVSGALGIYRCRRCNKPVPNAAQACPACGNPSPLAPLYPSIRMAAIAAGLAAWHFAAAQPSWARGLWTVGTAGFIFAAVGPILFQVWLGRLKKKSD